MNSFIYRHELLALKSSTGLFNIVLAKLLLGHTSCNKKRWVQSLDGPPIQCNSIAKCYNSDQSIRR